MRAALLACLFSASGAALAAPTYDQAGATPCRQFLKPRLRFELTDAIVTHVYETNAFGEQVGNACNIVDYVKAECRAKPSRVVREAVDALAGKARDRKPFPRIGMCGA